VSEDTWIYTAIIRPMLTYGAIAWGPKVLQATAIGELYQIQRMACLNITGAMRTTPTEAMELVTGLTPLHLYVKEVALMALLRLRTAGVNPEVGAGQLRLSLWRDPLTALALLISDWPLSSKETPPYYGASGQLSMQDV